MKLGPEQNVQMPMKTVISLIIMVSLGTMGYFQIQEKLNQHDTLLQMHTKDLDQNSEFRIKYPRGELGQSSGESELFMLVEHMAGQITKIENAMGNMMQINMALAGTGMSKGIKYENLRMVGTMIPFRWGIAVRNDSNIKKMTDLKGKRIPHGHDAGPLFHFLYVGVLASAGLTYDDVERIPVVLFKEGWNNFRRWIRSSPSFYRLHRKRFVGCLRCRFSFCITIS